ncbi:MAG: hypothetical protein WC957_07950, partial [Candidatus Neomarinimicrobiota bacterium]
NQDLIYEVNIDGTNIYHHSMKYIDQLIKEMDYTEIKNIEFFTLKNIETNEKQIVTMLMMQKK